MVGSAHGAALIEELVERKRLHFGDDQRLIGEFQVTRKHGEMHLWAEARDPYSLPETKA